MSRRSVLVILLALAPSACDERRAPPSEPRDAALPVRSTSPMVATAPSSPAVANLGTIDDNLPFVPSGQQLASTAFRTWIYTDVGPSRTRYGYLRVGAIVDARGPEIKNDGCAEGWWRINPRGFVCLGKGATLALTNPVVQGASVRPVRGAGYPYLYAMASDSPPHFYFQLPSREQVMAVEGGDPSARIARFSARLAQNPVLANLLGAPTEPPAFLLGARLEKPWGVERRLEKQISAGRAAADSGFAIARTMVHDGRWYGMTTEHDLIALDRVEPVVQTAVVGIEVPPLEGATVAFGDRPSLARFRLDERGQMLPNGALLRREAVVLTGRRMAPNLVETLAGDWVAAVGLRVIPVRREFPSVATGERKWIDISIRRQTLMAYVGRRPVYGALVSTGRGGMGDPETEFATVRGTFMIYAKHVAATMDGSEDVSDSYSLLDVPFVQYFHKGYALHGTYWHDEFGRVRSHGCINLTPRDAAWLFEWTDPNVPSDWHGVINKERGTVVIVRG